MVTAELAIIFAQRIWQSFAGLITVVLVLTYLSPAEQGWYYTFLSIVAWYTVFEFGFSTVLLHTSASVFSGLRWVKNGNLIGDNPERFSSFLSQAISECSRLMLKVGFIVLIAGLIYFLCAQGSQTQGRDWIAPWVVLVFSTGLSMLTLCYLSIIEGTGNIIEVYLVRLAQITAATLLSWCLMVNGLGMWAAVALPTASWTIALLWLLFLRRNGFKMLTKSLQSLSCDWLLQIKKFRQKTAVGWVGIYGTSQLITPILFHFEGPEKAGRFGLSLAVAHMIGILAQSAVASLLPTLSVGAIEHNIDLLRRYLIRASTGFVTIFTLGALILLLVSTALDVDTFGGRLLESNEMIGLLVFTFFYQAALLILSAFRASLEDPLGPIYAIAAVIIVSGSLLLVFYGESDKIISLMLIIQIGVIFPAAVWQLKKRFFCN